MAESTEKVEREGFTIRPSRMALLRQLPQFTGMGTTAIMVDLIEGAISGRDTPSPFGAVGLIGVIPDWRHHDYTDHLYSQSQAALTIRDYPSFRQQHGHWDALTWRFSNECDTFIALPKPDNAIERATLAELTERAAEASSDSVTMVVVRDEFNLMPPFTLLGSDTIIFTPYTPYAGAPDFALVFDGRTMQKFFLTEGILHGYDKDEDTLVNIQPLKK